MKQALAASLLALGLVLGSARAARADVAPPNSSECNGKAAGDACLDDNQKPGICTAATCSKLDYSHGTPPTSVDYACTLCNATDGGTSTSTPGSSSTSSGGCAVAPAPTGGAWWLAAAFALPLLRRRRAR